MADGLGRRQFTALMAAGLVAPRLTLAAPACTLIKPPCLRPGATIGLVAPGGYTTEAAIAKAVRNIESLGCRIKEGASLRAVFGNYAGTVQQRLDDLHAMFADPAVDAIWAIRGGAGCISLLAGLDYALIRAHPKILLGYSDITALHLAIHRHAGLVTVHGPVASSTLSDYAMEQLLAVLADPQPRTVIPMSSANAYRGLTEPLYATRTVHAGVATGVLMGGNLSMVSALAGTPYAADIAGALVFLEEVNEAPYRIDRWMTQLDLAGGLHHAAAVIIGICANCGPEPGDQSLTLDQTLALHLDPLAIPAVTGYAIGHIRHQCTLPIGVMATLDTHRQTITLHEAAVSAHR
jgi:muramoyltetrapeptide carboxypeptidase